MSPRSLFTACLALGVLVLVSRNKEKTKAMTRENPSETKGVMVFPEPDHRRD